MTTENDKPDTGEENEESTESTEETLLDVIGAAVDEVTPDDVLAANKPAEDDSGNDSGDKGADGETPAAGEGNDSGDEKAAAEAAEKAAAEAAEKAAAEADQTPEEKAAAEKAAAEASAKQTPEEKAAAEAAAEAAAKVDPISDPIAEGTNEKTAARIKSLINIAKENTQHASERDELMTQITNTGADPSQYANTLGFLKLYNSKTATDRQQALQVAEGIVRELQVELGVGTVNLLESHAELKAEVEAGTLTQERAVEIATSREQKVLSDSRTAAASESVAADEQTLALITTGKEQLNVLETTLKASDPDYDRLRALFIGVLKPTLREIHPTKWGEIAQTTYQQIKAANPAPTEKPAPALKNTPLRPKGSGGGSADKEGEPESALAAVNSALGAM